MKRYCPECNTGNDPASARCISCGAKLTGRLSDQRRRAYAWAVFSAVALAVVVRFLLTYTK